MLVIGNHISTNFSAQSSDELVCYVEELEWDAAPDKYPLPELQVCRLDEKGPVKVLTDGQVEQDH